MTSALRWDRVTRDYGAGEGVREVEIQIEPGEFFVLLGPSGSGKSTLLRIAGGFEIPDAGTVWLADRNVTRVPAERRPTAMVFQNHALWPHMTVADNITFGLRIQRRPREERRQRLRELLKLVRLEGMEGRRPGQLSGGQRQRVALARALAVEPEVLLLDEPLSSLDARLREDLRGELRDLQSRLEVTMVYVTHDQEDALALADRVGVLNEGRLIQVGTPEEVYERPANAFVARFCGKTILLPVAGVENGSGSPVAHLNGGGSLQVAGGDPNATHLAARAEAVAVSPTPEHNALAAKVAGRRYVDGRVALRLDTPSGQISVETTLPGPQIGEACFVVFPPERAWLVA